MFRKLAPQKVQHDEGYIVQVASRTCVEYLEPHRKATIEVEFGKSVGLFTRTLSGWLQGTTSSPMSPGERETIIERIAAGLAAMGVSEVQVS